MCRELTTREKPRRCPNLASGVSEKQRCPVSEQPLSETQNCIEDAESSWKTISGSALDNNRKPADRCQWRDFGTRMVQAASPARERSPSSTILSGDASRRLGRWERTPKGMPVDFAPDLYQAAGSKELDGTIPDDIGPTTLLGNSFVIRLRTSCLTSFLNLSSFSGLS